MANNGCYLVINTWNFLYNSFYYQQILTAQFLWQLNNGLAGQGIKIQFLSWADFTFLQCPKQLWCLTSLLSNGHQKPFSWGNGADQLPPSSAKVKNTQN
jgi:hypothetical protein